MKNSSNVSLTLFCIHYSFGDVQPKISTFKVDVMQACNIQTHLIFCFLFLFLFFFLIFRHFYALDFFVLFFFFVFVIISRLEMNSTKNILIRCGPDFSTFRFARKEEEKNSAKFAKAKLLYILIHLFIYFKK